MKALVISAVLVAGVTLLIASALTTVNKPSDAQVRAAVGALGEITAGRNFDNTRLTELVAQGRGATPDGVTLTAQLAADDRQTADQLAAHAWPKPSHAAIGLLIAALHTQHDRLETVGAAAANGDEIGQDEAGALAAF